MIYVVVCSISHAQKIDIDRGDLIVITKLAEKSKLYEAENTTLIVNNYKLKQQNEELQKQLEQKRVEVEALESVQKKFIWAIVGFAVLLGMWLAAKIFRPKWL